MRTAHASDVGRRRSRNEDAYLEDVSRRLFVVADGLGGHPAGDVASRLAVEVVAEELEVDVSGDGLMQRMSDVLDEANQAVVSVGRDDASKRGMGTTAVVAHLSEDEQLLTLAHVGDSRAYVLRDGELLQATHDHVTDNMFGRTLTQAIGSVDGIDPEAAEIPLAPGDRILLCTDGLTDMLDDEEIAEVLTGDCDPDECCDELVERALVRQHHADRRRSPPRRSGLSVSWRHQHCRAAPGAGSRARGAAAW